MTCIYCGLEKPAERPYDHCSRKTCVDTWLIARRSQMSMVLMHKVGYIPQFTDRYSGTNKNGV